MMKFITLIASLALVGSMTVQADTTALQTEAEGYFEHLVHLQPFQKSGVNLRAGPGTDHEVVEQTFEGMAFLASDKNLYPDKEGKSWYKIEYQLIPMEETAIEKPQQEMYIRSDIVKASSVNKNYPGLRMSLMWTEFKVIESTSFMPDNPQFKVATDLKLLKTCEAKEAEVEVAAQSPLGLFVLPSLCTDAKTQKSQVFIQILEKYGDKGLHSLGFIAKPDFDALEFSENGDAAKQWVDDYYQRANLEQYVGK